MKLNDIPNIAKSGCGGYPANIIMLTCDAFGVLPPIARLTAEKTMFHFLSGYTAKVAGTDAGVFEKDAFFGLDIPTSCTGVPGDVLNPRNTRADKKMYDEAVTRLVGMFKENFEKYAPTVTAMWRVSCK
ncbi:hypothetical protein Dvar_57230 [Desulfosarcina variabilis str. Montpellier]|uniref:phosphoenolpyruvate carboxykinase (ATP) n=1 Tax=Desulfosarcina variabilis TaxID=2300 RepID=UPI003AFA329A